MLGDVHVGRAGMLGGRSNSCQIDLISWWYQWCYNGSFNGFHTATLDYTILIDNVDWINNWVTFGIWNTIEEDSVFSSVGIAQNIQN